MGVQESPLRCAQSQTMGCSSLTLVSHREIAHTSCSTNALPSSHCARDEGHAVTFHSDHDFPKSCYTRTRTEYI